MRSIMIPSVLLLLATSASADLPVAYVKVQPDPEGLVVVIYPHRDGQVFHRDTGVEVDETPVQVGEATDDLWGECFYEAPMPAVQDIEVQPLDDIDGLAVLDHLLGLDGAPGADGWTEVALGQLRGGGHSDGPVGFRASVPGHGVCVLDTRFELEIRSPDINGDLLVDLTDITMFVAALGTDAAYADFNADGRVGLADIVRMVQALGDED